MPGLAKWVKAKNLQASIGEVHDDPMVHPQQKSYGENVDPTGLRACHDEGKRCAETLFFDCRRQSGVKIKAARTFNTYGPRMRHDDGRVISNFIVQVLRFARKMPDWRPTVPPSTGLAKTIADFRGHRVLRTQGEQQFAAAR